MPNNETIIVGDYYIDKNFMKLLYNNVKEEIQTENRLEARIRQRKREEVLQKEREERTYYANQKLMAIFISGLIVVSAVLASDATCLLGLPISVYMAFTKYKFLVNGHFWKEKDRQGY